MSTALATDYFHVREQFSDAEWERFIATRRFVDEEVLPAINAYWEAAELPWPLMRRLAELGLFEPMSPLAEGLVHMELHRGDGSLGTFYGVQKGLAMTSIEMLGSDAQKQRWLPRLASLDAIGAFALTEPDHGSDSVALETTATQTADGWIINGAKRWIGNGSISDVTVVWARDTADGQVKGFLVETDQPGYQATTMTGKGAARAIWQADIELHDVRGEHLPGTSSFKDAGRVLVTTRGTCAWAALGHAVASYDAALTYAKQREQFGKPLVSFQLVQDRLVKMLADVTGMQLYCMQLARLEEAGRMTDTIAGLAKLNNTRTARRVIAEARDLLGGNGVLLENHVIRHMTDIEVIHTYEGTETMQALIVGRDITGVGAFNSKDKTMNLAELLTRSDRIAIRLDDRTLTYAELDDAAARMSALLKSKGVEPGDRVGLMAPNVPEFAIAYFGALRAGAAVVPMNPLLKEREVDHYLTDSGAKLVLTPDTDYTTHEPDYDIADRDPSDTAVLLYTSGTTGSPKGAQLTHANLIRNVATAVDIFDLGSDTVTLGALPLFHAFGQTCALNATIAVGGTLTLLPRFDAGRALEIIARDGVTVFEGVPTMYTAMLNHPGEPDASSLSVCVSGGASMPVEVMRGFEERYGCDVLEGYGLSETSPIASFNRRDRRKPGSIGLPVLGVEMKLVDGEIAIRGHNVMKGYWGIEGGVDADGWFLTGDMGRIDEDGYFFIVDRKKDMVIRGGFNIYPREIEEVFYEHPAVLEAAVIGIPDERLGEEVGAAVALKGEATPEELRTFVKERVAAYKYPRVVWIVDALPKGATGKVLKREIVVP